MKFSKLNKLAGAFFALVPGTTVAFSQGRQCFYTQNIRCSEYCYLYKISDLTELQKKTIVGLNEKHRTVMAELRDKRI